MQTLVDREYGPSRPPPRPTTVDVFVPTLPVPLLLMLTCVIQKLGHKSLSQHPAAVRLPWRHHFILKG